MFASIGGVAGLVHDNVEVRREHGEDAGQRAAEFAVEVDLDVIRRRHLDMVCFEMNDVRVVQVLAAQRR